MRYRQILLMFIGLLYTLQATSQAMMPDSICIGAQKHYWVYGDPGSTYTWTLTDPSGTTSTLPVTGDTAVINWMFTPGAYTLTTIQHSIYNCDGASQSGIIELFEQAIAFAGNPKIFCTPDPYLLSDATASNYRSLLWTTSGDGTFDHKNILHPVYSPGPGDLLAGTVTLTLSAQGWGSPATCTPAVSSVLIHQSATIVSVSITSSNVTCFGWNNGTATAAASGGTRVFTYLWDDPAAQTTPTATGLYAGTYSVIVTDENGCSDTASVTITQPPPLVASAGPDAAICQNNQYSISGSSATSYSSILWTHTGLGTLMYADSVHPTYIPALNETGTIHFTMNAYNIPPCQEIITDQMELIIYPVPTAALTLTGKNTFCEGDSTSLRFDLTGSAPWSLTYTDGVISFTINNIGSTPLIVPVFPTYTSTYSITSLSDIHCSAALSNLTGTAVVNVFQKPDVEFTWVKGSKNYEIIFTIDTTITDLAAIGNMISWSFGDGTYGHNVIEDHLFPAPNTYPVLLTVTDTNGCSNSVTHNVTLTGAPHAFFSSTGPVCFGKETCFTDLSWVDDPVAEYITTWIWNYGDGSPADTVHFPANPNTCHQYLTVNTFPVTLKVIDNLGLSDVYTANSAVLPDPVADFTHSAVLCPDQEVSFTDESSSNGGGSISSWNWNFDDPGSGLDNTSNLENPGHGFTHGDSTYHVKLIVINLNGCRDTVIKPVYIHPKPAAGFNFTTACMNQPVHFEADTLIMHLDSISGWSWDFGDGTSHSNAPIATEHTYSAVGLYPVTLTVTDIHGCKNSVTHTLQVNPLPVAAFSWSEPVCQHSAVQFTDHSSVSAIYSGYIVKWVWDFGDGITQTIVLPASPNLSHVFAGPATSHLVRLTVWTNDSCTDFVEHLINSIPEPTADFTYSTINCTDQAVQFTDQSSTNGGGNIAQWAWDFGDPASGTNNNSTLQNPSHDYTASGTYSVKLIVTNASSCADTVTKTILINVKPVAGFSADTACLGNPTNFTDLSVPNAPAIISYLWNFGDGSPESNMKNPSHTYQGAGLFTVTLTVTNSNGCMDMITKQVPVNPLPVAAFYFTASNCQGSPVCFTDASSTPQGYNGIIIKWDWEFGDGNVQTVLFPGNPNVCHLYTGTSTTYIVRLTVTTSDTCSHFTEHTVTLVPAPLADFEYSGINCPEIPVQFSDKSQTIGGGQIISWNWNFGDPLSGSANNSNLKDPVHMYAAPGNYMVTLIVGNNGSCMDTVVKTITINQSPVADFAADTVCAGNPTTFTDLSVPNSNGIISWSWDFGDGSPSGNTKNPVHTYSGSGLFNVKLSVVNSNGCTGEITKPVMVNPLPVAAFLFPQNNCLGAEVCYTDISSVPQGYTGNIVKWVWDFGDGTSPVIILFPANPNICHTFAGNALSHLVSLTVETSDGCTDQSVKTVNSTPAPVAEFEFSTNPCHGQAVQFNDQSQPAAGPQITQWHWNFGDPASGANNLSVLQNPTHLFSAPGFYTVTLFVVSQNLCSDTISHLVNVNMMPLADFSADTSCLEGVTHFTDLSVPNASGISTYSWDFGDGSPHSTNANPTHIYTNYGLFNVTLSITNSNGCTGDTTLAVLVRPLPVPAFAFTTPHCQGSPVSYTDQSGVVPGYSDPISTWIWEFGDGSSPVTINSPASPDVVHIFTGNALTHTVRLTVITLSGCTAFVENLVTSIPAPLANFTYPAANCSTQTVQFTDQSLMNGGGPVAGWNWNFGDPGSGANNLSNIQNPVHTFSNSGSFTVTLITFNSTNCSDTAEKTVAVSTGPIASFTSDTACLGSVTTFTDQSTVPPGSGNISSHFWAFGDGGTSTQTNPAHLYSNPGNYDVTLTVTTSLGCIKDTTLQVLVNALPTASFSYSQNTCEEDSIQFTDLSSTQSGMIVRWKWEFGDGQSKTVYYPDPPNVKHSYGYPGNYLVTLTVSTSDSCSSSKAMLINIYAKPAANYSYSVINCQDIPVQFTDNSQGGGSPVISWSWNFGDPGSGSNNTSSQQNPSHIYSSAGSYQVILAVANANGCIDSITKTLTINAAPVAQFTADTSCAGKPTHFTDGSTPGSGTLAAWQWDFGDPSSGTNNTSSQQNPAHTYANPGIYNVTLAVTNSNSCTSDTIIPVIVSPAPEAMFSYSASCTGDSTRFTDLSVAPNSQIIGWFWDFGDGGTSVLQNPKHAYMNAGNYIVKLVVTNLGGCADSIAQQVVARPKPVAAFIYNTFYCPAGKVMFQDQSQGSGASIAERLWIFEPGMTSDLANPVYIFGVTDTTYMVTLIVTDSYGCKDTLSKGIYVKPGFRFTFNYDIVCLGAPTHFTPANNTPGDSLFYVTWDFGDPATGSGNTSHEYSPVHIFSHAGIFTVKMKAWNWDNCVDSVYKQVTVHKAPQVFFITTSEPCNTVVQFTDQSNPGSGTIIDWEWNFGDGTPPLNIAASGTGNITHTYPEIGSYTASLKVTNSNGCISIFTDTVQLVPCISASFEAESTTCANSLITFRDNSSPVSAITSWHWLWNDGTDTTYTVYAAEIRHLFANQGDYQVKLIIKAMIGTKVFSDTIMRQIKILSTPEANFTNEGVCLGRISLFRDGSTTSGTESLLWNWNFGDPASGQFNNSSVRNPSHSYKESGIYQVKLVVKNKSGCADSLIKPTRIFGVPLADFTSTNACKGSSTRFTDLSVVKDTALGAWQWNFGVAGTRKDTSNVQNPAYQYNSEGNYNVRLLVKDLNGCTDTVDSVISVHASPLSAFTLTDNLNGMPGKVKLINQSEGSVAYEWDFGNGSTSTEESPITTYTLDGTYLIMLVSHNSYDCTDTTYYNYEMLFKGLYIPNAFSPANSNQAIRLFKPAGKNLRQYNIQVYDYLGHLLWESSALDSEGRPTEGWDGTYKGNLMPQATYMWKATAVFIDGTIWEGSDIGQGMGKTMGTVTLVR